MTPRDIARRHWGELAGLYANRADPDAAPTPETMAWLRAVALKMIAADALPAADRREDVFDASGLKGAAEDGMLAVIFIALRKYERFKAAKSKQVAGLSAAEFVAAELEWDTDHDVAADSHRKRIARALATLPVESPSRVWASALIGNK